MKKCQVCGKEEYEGALFCSECGERLERKENFSRTELKEFQEFETCQNGNVIFTEDTILHPLPGMMCIKLVESGKVIPLQKSIPMIFGRLVDGQPLLPDVDLTDLSVYANGVSRLHAEFCWTEEGVFVSDLGSVNKTKINGISIQSNNWIRVNIGDIVELGKVKTEITIC